MCCCGGVCVCVCLCMCMCVCLSVKVANYLFLGSTVPYSEIRSSCIKPPFFYEMIGHTDGSC